MKKNIKIPFLIILAAALLFCLGLVYKLLVFDKTNSSSVVTESNSLEDSPQESAKVIEVIDPSVMTLDERLQFKCSPSVRIDVWQRNASGTILVYKKISEEDYKARLAQIAEAKRYDKNNQGENVEILNDEDKYKLGLFHLGVYEVVARNENGGISAYRYLRTDNESKLALEWLSENEKNELGLDPAARVQLLKRSESGKILAYKIIKDDADILDSY